MDAFVSSESAGRGDCRTATVPGTQKTGDYGDPDSVADGRWGQVAERVAKRARVKPGTVHSWLHSTTQMRLSERLALIVEVCGELEAHELLAQVMSPIRAAEGSLRDLPVRECLHELREAKSLVDVMLCRYFDRPDDAVRALLAALAWSTQCCISAQRALRTEVQ